MNKKGILKDNIKNYNIYSTILNLLTVDAFWMHIRQNPYKVLSNTLILRKKSLMQEQIVQNKRIREYV